LRYFLQGFRQVKESVGNRQLSKKVVITTPIKTLPSPTIKLTNNCSTSS